MVAPAEVMLITGFTGFLGRRLVARLLATRPQLRLVALVRAASMARAQQAVAALGAADRVELVSGDLAADGLALQAPAALARRVVEIFHLAALYDLACSAAAATAANVDGTRHLLAFAASCPRLRRLHYVSTCYVAGTHAGHFGEGDLDVGQGFLNHYDQTKFAAEKLVRDYRGQGGVTVYRPAIVVGDATHGDFDKADGPYLVMEAMQRLPSPGVFARIGSGTAPVNLVPVDFVVSCLAYLSGLPDTAGGCYHLADPRPMTAAQIQRRTMALLHRRFLLVPLPASWVAACLRWRFLSRLIGLPAEVVPYFDYRAEFDTSRCQAALAASGIRCPQLADYLPVLVRAWQARRAAAPV
jgi:thioester reductase-like protein